jgi:hypothetical protein
MDVISKILGKEILLRILCGLTWLRKSQQFLMKKKVKMGKYSAVKHATKRRKTEEVFCITL